MAVSRGDGSAKPMGMPDPVLGGRNDGPSPVRLNSQVRLSLEYGTMEPTSMH